MWKHVNLSFSRTEACLTLVGSETLDTNLDIIIPKLGLDIATEKKFGKRINVKINDKDVIPESDSN